jgi:hypothetical protein
MFQYFSGTAVPPSATSDPSSEVADGGFMEEGLLFMAGILHLAGFNRGRHFERSREPHSAQRS